MKKSVIIFTFIAFLISGCKKSGNDGGNPTAQPPAPDALTLTSIKINGQAATNVIALPANTVVKFSFSAPVNKTSVANAFTYKNKAGSNLSFNTAYENADSTVVVQTATALPALDKYIVSVNTNLTSVKGGKLDAVKDQSFTTGIDSSRKFPTITDNELLTKIQQQTFKYFWDFAHPISGLARERSNGDNEIVTSGGSGFGIMALLVGINRNFVTRAQALARMQTIVSFLKNTAKTVHGAYPHWLNGSTGAIIPFSEKDNGADLVETSYLMQGLLSARQYFNAASSEETALRNDINTIWNRVEWDWFRRGGQDVLYWHYSENFTWDMNLPIKGWNECLITYVLAAASTTHGIPVSVYNNGWKSNGTNGYINQRSYYGIQLPLGPDYGGPLFFSHYSFLGIDPNGLTDASSNYTDQTRNHTLINYNYCVTNPRHFYGYSDSVWGLTASDIENGYNASSPTNDLGFIAPTAAISSLPYTPVESMKALKFFYYVLGDKLFNDYGFIDAFNLQDPWFASSYLAIDQGPIITMIENYRTNMLWTLFTSCPEVQNGMIALGFTANYL